MTALGPAAATPSAVSANGIALDAALDTAGPDTADLELALTTLPPGRGRLIVMLPAHNEQAGIDHAIDSLAGQTRRPDLVVVVPDNCTDRTAELAAAHDGVVVAPSRNNEHKKAGALNQILARMLPLLEADDAIMVMDADSALDHEFLGAALTKLGKPARGDTTVIGGVGGTFRGGEGGGFVGMLQRNEYARYARDVRRRKGKVLVLTGTAAIFRVDVLRKVIEARANGTLPGGAAAGIGQVYDTNVLTEDNELTLALLHLGYGILSPKECLLETEIMTSWKSLWDQRLRWKRGALENLIDYGLTRVTWRYWGRQVLTHVGVLVTAIYLLSVAYSLLFAGTVHLHPVWTLVTLVFTAERVVSVRERGRLQMLFASLLVVEMAFDFFLQATQAKALWDTLRHSEKNW
ncbi:MAG TPA: glycosyltransferase family 2 protein [Jatrophihabitans sp.]|jgi:cellulose synthase/poly-beta-1,6-N-acetylglucosamine synthase-like glycosyltransferase